MNNFMKTLILVGLSLSDRIAGEDIKTVDTLNA